MHKGGESSRYILLGYVTIHPRFEELIVIVLIGEASSWVSILQQVSLRGTFLHKWNMKGMRRLGVRGLVAKTCTGGTKSQLRHKLSALTDYRYV